MKIYDIGIDVGGTFTDLVSFDVESSTLAWKKVPTTPENPVNGVLAALEGKAPKVNRIIHGTTIATNAILQKNGARVAIITTKGLKDQIEIGDTLRYTGGLHDHRWIREKPFMVPSSYRYEVDERVTHTGDVDTPLNKSELLGIVEQIEAEGIEAVAVCFLNSYINDTHETAAVDFLKEKLPHLWVTHSAFIPEYREFPRFMTAVLSAYVAPILGAYVNQLAQKLEGLGYDGEVSYMTSSGGTCSAEKSMLSPISIVGSGVAGGASATAALSKKIGATRIINFEMGGTSTDVCIVKDHKPGLSTSKVLLAFPILSPEVDVKSIGAGGGSIAWVDQDGRLKVGPGSAGADPGPACYASGGRQLTVTDANLLLGRIGVDTLIGGEMTLHEDLALEVAQELGSTVNLPDVGILAEGILEIAVTHMYGAVRELTIEQGEDPAEYKLAATGGAGPLHAIALARMLGIETIVVPPSPGTFSAMGMLVSDLRHDYVRTYLKPIIKADVDEINSRFESMRNEAKHALKKDGVSDDRSSIELFVEMRYLEQSFVEHIEIDGFDISLTQLADAFSAAYEDRYGYCREEEMIEIVNLRLVATAAVRTPSSQKRREPARHQAVKATRQVQFFGEKAQCPIYARIDLARDQVIYGPAIIEEYASTTALFPDWQLRVDEFDNLIITPASS